MASNGKKLLALIGPGILVAATGVGAGDLATSAFTGSALGLTVLWAVVLGAFFKFVLNEGLARWQLATGRTLVEGCSDRFGKAVQWFFLGYLLVWSFLVAAALMSAMGVTCHAIWPLFGADAVQTNKIAYGVLHSLLAVALVRLAGYRLFEKVMSVCIGLMFVIVVLTAITICPSWTGVATGLLVPTIPSGGVLWTIALMGGVGGTVTVLSYGYWIREEGRVGINSLTTCRIDLAAGYLMTAVFGLGMVIIGSSLKPMQGGGAGLIVNITQQLEAAMGAAGPAARWAFLIGAWGAVFSSLLGVWQSIPYLFADVWSLMRGEDKRGDRVDTNSRAYRGYLYGIALIPIVGLVAIDFQTMQKTYAIVGALFVPMLAVVLLLLNGRSNLVGQQFKNSLGTSAVLVAVVLFFLFAGGLEVRKKLFPAEKSKPRIQSMRFVSTEVPDAPPDKVPDAVMHTAREIMGQVQVFRVDADSQEPLTRVRDPVLRSSNAAREHQDGTLWVFGTPGRPVALITCVTRNARQGQWWHSATLVTGDALRVLKEGTLVWTPTGRGIEFGKMEAPFHPADTKQLRLAQLRSLARRFTAHQFWDPNNQRFQLRLQTTPVYRYQAVDKGLLDGCVFAFSYDAHPEMLLVLEATQDDDGRSWRYAFAPIGSAEFHAQLNGVEVWSLPRAPGVVGRITDSYRMFFSSRKVELAEPATDRK